MKEELNLPDFSEYQDRFESEFENNKFSDLPPIEKIKLAATEAGVKILDLNSKEYKKKNCGKCNIKGYTGVYSKSQIPIPCKCIFHKDDLNKVFTGQKAMTSKEIRKYELNQLKSKISHSKNEENQAIKSNYKKKRNVKKKLDKLSRRINKR